MASNKVNMQLQAASPLLELPAEIRNEIYGLVLELHLKSDSESREYFNLESLILLMETFVGTKELHARFARSSGLAISRSSFWHEHVDGPCGKF